MPASRSVRNLDDGLMLGLKRRAVRVDDQDGFVLPHYDKTARNFLAGVCLAAVLIWWIN